MQRLAIEALKHKYAAEMADAEFVLSIYLKRAVGVGEHPGLLEEMDVALEKWVNANDKMGALAALTWRRMMALKKSQRSLKSVD